MKREQEERKKLVWWLLILFSFGFGSLPVDLVISLLVCFCV